MKLPHASGPKLSQLAAQYGMPRSGILERLPLVGDALLRLRINTVLATWTEGPRAGSQPSSQTRIANDHAGEDS